MVFFQIFSCKIFWGESVKFGLYQTWYHYQCKIKVFYGKSKANLFRFSFSGDAAPFPGSLNSMKWFSKASFCFLTNMRKTFYVNDFYNRKKLITSFCSADVSMCFDPQVSGGVPVALQPDLHAVSGVGGRARHLSALRPPRPWPVH